MEWTQRLKMRRTELGLGQQAIADHVGKSRGAVAQWETAKTRRRFLPPDEMRKLAEILALPLNTLMWGEAIEGNDPGPLNEDERAMVLGYRRLTPTKRDILRGVLQGFLSDGKGGSDG